MLPTIKTKLGKTEKDITIFQKKKFKPLDGDLLLTTACPVTCDFCVYSCAPNGEWMPKSTIRRVVEEYTRNDIGIRISGGEPFLDLKKLETCLKIILKYQKPYEILIITSGFFAVNKTETRKNLGLLKKYDMDTLVVSADRFHLKSVPLRNINNILEEAKRIGLRIILRITLDLESEKFIKDIVQLIVKHKPGLEMHYDWGIFGRGELIKNFEKLFSPHVKKMFISELNIANKEHKIKDLTNLFIQSPKRSQKDFAAKFFPTTFPNGETYGDSLCCKGVFMGNINKESLKSMIEKFKKTLPGFILYSKQKDCGYILKLLQKNSSERCNYCRNYPFKEQTPDYAVGREFVKLKTEALEQTLKKFKNPAKELLLSFELEENDLNLTTGDKIIEFLQGLENKSIRFRLSRPLPKCLFGLKHQEITQKYHVPKDCFECDELFSVEDGSFMGCASVGVKGPGLDLSLDRRKAWSFFNQARLKKKPLDKCKRCKYFIRRNCDGLCFRKHVEEIKK